MSLLELLIALGLFIASIAAAYIYGSKHKDSRSESYKTAEVKKKLKELGDLMNSTKKVENEITDGLEKSKLEIDSVDSSSSSVRKSANDIQKRWRG